MSGKRIGACCVHYVKNSVFLCSEGDLHQEKKGRGLQCDLHNRVLLCSEGDIPVLLLGFHKRRPKMKKGATSTPTPL